MEASTKYNLRSRRVQKNIDDFTCILCYEILIEPCKLACNHVFCMPCSKKLVGFKSYKCPICRHIIPPHTNIDNLKSLVDKNKWEEVRTNFLLEVKARVKEIRKQEIEENLNSEMIKQIIVSFNLIL